MYHFARISDPASLRDPLLALLRTNQVRGTILLAGEGVNGTVAGPREGIDQVLTFLKQQPGLDQLTHKESICDEQPFKRTKVRLKKEIVTMGVDGIDPNQIVGTYVTPQQWNEHDRRP